MAPLTTTLPRVLGALFYYPPTTGKSQKMIQALSYTEELFGWSDSAVLRHDVKTLATTNPADITYDFSVLFEGQGHMIAPPWGSVYLEEDHLLMGNSAQAFRSFLAQHHLRVATDKSEPDDQFGLMLMAFAMLLEKGKDQAGETLLSDHLLTWSPRYLTLLSEAKTEHPFYPMLARIASLYLNALKIKLDIQVKPRKLFF